MTAQAMRPVRPDNFSTIPSAQTEERHYPWWQVMCLSGVEILRRAVAEERDRPEIHVA